MNDLSKILSGISMNDKLYSQYDSINSITAISHPLNIFNWIQRSEEIFTLNAIAGNSLQMWESLTKMPKIPVDDYTRISAITSISQWINNLPKTNPALDSISSLAGKMNWISSFDNYINLDNDFNWSKPFLPGYNGIQDITKLSNHWTSLFDQQTVKKKRKKKTKVISSKIERFAENVANVYSEVEDFDELQKVELANNVTEVLTHEVQLNNDSVSYNIVLGWVLDKYNLLIETAFVKRNIESLKEIHEEIKKITIVKLITFLIITGTCGIIETKGGQIYNYATNNEEDIQTQIIYSYKAETNISKSLFTRPDGRSKKLCIIPDCTEVQLGEISGKYIYVTVLHNGSIIRGWCLNKEFGKIQLLP